MLLLCFFPPAIHVCKSAKGDQKGHSLPRGRKSHHRQRNAERGSAVLPQEPSTRSYLCSALSVKFLESRVNAANPSLYAAPAESKIQDARLGPCSTELHASPYLGEVLIKIFPVFNLHNYDITNVCFGDRIMPPCFCKC